MGMSEIRNTVGYCYIFKTIVKVRIALSTSADMIGAFSADETVDTDQTIIQNGYRWVRQSRFNGYGYLATGRQAIRWNMQRVVPLTRITQSSLATAYGQLRNATVPLLIV